MRARMRDLVLSLAILALLAPPGLAVEGDEHWSPTFALPGADASVHSALEFDGDLIIGGDFLHVGTCAASRIARWDGSDWHALGDGFDGAVRALLAHDGELYAAGDFDHSGSTPIQGVARWDGTTWQALGEQINYYSVRCLATFQGSLIVGGVADGMAEYGEWFQVGGIAAWNGAQWTELAAFEWCASTACGVEALGVLEDELVIGGGFESLNGDWNLAGIARWDGTTWRAMGTLMGVSAFVMHGSQLVAAAWRALYRWEDPVWVQESSNLPSSINDIASYGTDIAATLSYSFDSNAGGVVIWTGAQWTPLGEPLDFPGDLTPVASCLTLCNYGNLLIAGGNFTQSGGAAVPNVTAWDGEHWQPLLHENSVPDLNGLDYHPYAMTLWEGDVVVGGSFDLAYRTALNGIGRWCEGDWQALGSGVSGGGETIFGLGAYQGDLVAMGRFQEIGGVPAVNMATWTGTEWLPCGGGQAPEGRDLLADGQNLYVAGWFEAAGGSPAGNIAMWDGLGWSNLAGGLNGSVYSLALYGGSLVAAGYFTEDAQAQPLARVARWDGVQWQPLGAGLNSAAHKLLVWNGDLVAGGNFTLADGHPTERLALWDGAGWQAFPSGPNARVLAMAVYHGDLVVAGDFTAVAELEAARIARWDGESWSPLGAGLPIQNYPYFSIQELLAVCDQLYVIGDFCNAGDKSAFGIACWTDGSSAVDPGPASAAPLGVWNVPNPFNPSTEIVFTLPAAAPVTLRIVDATGRCVRTLLAAAPRLAGEQRVSWDGRDDAGRRLPSGAYLYELETGGSRAAGKMLLLK